MEKDPVSSEEDNSENGRENMKAWFVENLRMIVSVVIVVAIAGGIYAYSQRTQAPSAEKETAVSEEGKISVIGGETEQEGADQESVQPTPVQPAEETALSEIQTSQETESSFVETAAKGDGATKLARRALANYLEKNPDAALTAEHKIYIEDLMRRQVKNGNLKIGDKREFTKDMIANAIEKSKKLNESQLKNLQKYSKNVPELK